MGVYNGDETRNQMQYYETKAFDYASNALRPQDAHSSVETRASTKSPNSGADAEDYQLMDELVDAEALALSMPQPELTRLSTDENKYGSYMAAAGEYAQAMMPSPTHSSAEQMSQHGMAPMAPHSPMGQAPYSMEMPSNMPMQMIPSNAPQVMYADMQQMQQNGAQQVQMQWPAQMQQQGQQQQFVQVPMMMPVRMVPVPMPMHQMQMGGQVGQAPQMAYYLVPDAAEQQQPQQSPVSGTDAGETPKNFLESLMPTGWRKRQRPSKRPAARMQKVPSGRKIFVGGLSPNSTAESLINHFSEFGKISDASVIHEAVTRKSRGFGYVEFADKIPDGLLDMEHFIDQRRCGVRGYNYDPADDVAASAA
jgi:hypothetical protein